MLILVTGWRSHPDEHAVYNVLDEIWRANPCYGQITVLHGDCPTGVDAYASTWCTYRRVPQKPFAARDYGLWPWCGPKRNTAMVQHLARSEYMEEKRVLAFPQPDWETARVSGTRDCIVKARKAGFEPEIYPALAVTR